MSLKFLFVSKDALISDISWQTVKEGQEVKYFIENKSEDDIANGFVPKTKAWRVDVDWSDVICYDKDTEVLTEKGWKLFKDLDNY